MTPSLTLQLSLGLSTALLLLPMPVLAADDTQKPNDGSPAQHAACKALHGQARLVCHEEEKGRDRVAHAERMLRDTGSAAYAHRLHVVRAQAAFAVSRQRCEAQSGQAQRTCIHEAKAVESQALADTKLRAPASPPAPDAGEAERAGQHRALEKCGAMAGEARNHCSTATKMKHRP